MTLAQEAGTTAERVIDEELALLAKALGNPARVRILRLLLDHEAYFCGEIVEQLPLAQATVSQHLKVLKEARLIEGEIDGPRTCYWVDRQRLAYLHSLLGGLLEDAVELTGERNGCR
jgi:ArsR family transcriptional regulator